MDLLAAQDLRYVPQADGFAVYSVGADGKDDADKSQPSDDRIRETDQRIEGLGRQVRLEALPLSGSAARTGPKACE